jgi:hypothetical protein
MGLIWVNSTDGDAGPIRPVVPRSDASRPRQAPAGAGVDDPLSVVAQVISVLRRIIPKATVVLDLGDDPSSPARPPGR